MLNVSIATIVTINKLDKTVTRENVMAYAHTVVNGVRAVIRGETYASILKVALKALYTIIKNAEAEVKRQANKECARRLNALIVGYGLMFKDLIRYTASTGFRLEEFEALQECRDIFKNGMFGSTPKVTLTIEQRYDIARRLKNHTEALLQDMLKVCPEDEKEILKQSFADTFK